MPIKNLESAYRQQVMKKLETKLLKLTVSPLYADRIRNQGQAVFTQRCHYDLISSLTQSFKANY